MNASAAPISAASIAKAEARFTASPLLRLFDDMMPDVLDEMVLKARKAKIAIDKLSEKQIQDCVHTVQEALIKEDARPEHYGPMLPGSNIPVAKAEAYARAYETIDVQPEDFEPEVKQETSSKSKKAKREIKQPHRSHLHCGHANSKVARARCRRETARKA